MKFDSNRRSPLVTGFLICSFLLLVPAAARTQDDKGTVNAQFASMATAAELLSLPGIWNVTGCCGWSGTWYRRPNTNIFDTKWMHTNGTPVQFAVELMTWNKATNLITFYQADNKGTYRAYLTNGGTAIVRGTTSFYPAGATWSALAVSPDDKGRVLIPR